MASVPLMSASFDRQMTEQTRSPRRKWGMLVVLSLALAIIILDTTILNVSLSAIIRDLHTDIQKLQWVITAYSLTLAALTITGGRLGDLFGRKRMFVVGAVLFAIGSFLASISTSVGVLIAGEAIIEGIGAALMMPATASLLVVNFQGRERAVAFGVWGGIAGAASALGPILGGYLTTHYNWRWGFRINLVVVVMLLIGSILIPESRDTEEKKELDFGGVLLSALGMLAFVFGIIEASTYGWWKAKAAFAFGDQVINFPFGLSIVPYCVALGSVILTAFLFWERRREAAGHTPLVSLSLFKNRAFTAGASTTAVMSLGQTGLIFALPVFLQSVRGFDAYHTGLALLPMSLALLVVAPLGAVLSKKILPKYLIQLGLLINVVAYVLLRYTLSIDTTTAELIPGLALFGIGMGLVMSQVNNLTLSSVPVSQAGEASGVNNTVRQVGATLGSAIIGTILIGTLGTQLVSGIETSTVIPDRMKPAVMEAIRSQASNVEFGGGAQLSGSVPPAIQTEILRVGHVATVEANKISLLYGAIFALLGFFVSFLLPAKAKKDERGGAGPVMTEEKVTAVSPELDTALVAELIQADLKLRTEGKAGLGADIRYVIDAALSGEAITQSAAPRIRQARMLWNAGVGKALGFTDFSTYLESIPQVPPSLVAPNAAFPELLLVDARLTLIQMSALLGVKLSGKDMDADQKELQMTSAPYWIRCQTGTKLQGKSVQEVEKQFATDERGLLIREGLALFAQTPLLLQKQYLDLPNSQHAAFEESVACLGLWKGSPELRWSLRGKAGPHVFVATAKR